MEWFQEWIGTTDAIEETLFLIVAYKNETHND